MIKIKKITVEPTDVYDITVPDTACFFANNILVHNCVEITLPTVAMGTTKKTLIKVKKDEATKFLLNTPEQFVSVKKVN